MAISIQFLHKTPIESIIDTFNKAFEGYFIPIVMNKESFEFKLIQESIELSLSIGAFDDDKLVGLILIGIKPVEETFYNAGTGVIPSHRSQQLTKRMYELLLQKMNTLGYKTGILEVVKQNDTAIHIYRTLGYKFTRSVDCYNCEKETLSKIDAGFQIFEIEDWSPGHWDAFCDWRPTWQNDNYAVSKIQQKLKAIEVKIEDNCVAYALFDPLKGRIHQLAVSENHRNKGIGESLMAFIADQVPKKISWTNIESICVETSNFLKGLGFEIFLSQYEMVLNMEE